MLLRYYKVYEDGSRIDICMYVDDGWSEDDAGPYADADLELLNARFNMEYTSPIRGTSWA